MTQLLVESTDGTPISCESYGEGRALLIVSGALFAAKLWKNVVEQLSADRCVYLMDRRGRGKSGDNAAYAPEREVEDVLAVLRAIPGPIDLLGHSSGAILSLQVAMQRPDKLERLVVYEPPVFFGELDRIAADLPERLEALLAMGNREAAVETFFREGPRASEAELRAMQSGPAWTQMVSALAHTVPYDSRIQRSFSGEPAELVRVQIPTLMLLGSASPARMRNGAETIVLRLPNARLSELDGQQHTAMLLAPAVFAARVSEFLT
ncbi:MAG TPA: alpha/beta hydrolase [Polyangiaceae bacterium]|jgi:pimeloyl-ACP methyl ester carboxylesterase|nr:alpha/beta hydrolase [Polyangiaceae bacterium]